MIKNCRVTPEEISANYSAWFRRLCGEDSAEPDGKVDWPDDVKRKLRRTFASGMTHVDKDLPTPFHNQLAVTKTSPPATLHRALQARAVSFTVWCDSITAAAELIHRDEIHRCSNPAPIADRLRKLVLARAALGAAVNVSDIGSYAAVCRVHVRWAKAFNQWGNILERWENTLADCASQNVSIKQITRPPWPPWNPGTFDSNED